MSIISYALKGNLKRFNDNLKEISKKENRSTIGLKFNFLNSFLTIGCGYSDYLNYELYKKTRKELKEYVSIKDQDKFYEIVSPSKYKETFTVKPNFLKAFKKYMNRDFYYDGDIKDLKKFLKDHKKFMIKPCDGLGGQGVRKVLSSQIKSVENLDKYLKENNCFIEDYVVQNKKVNEICSNSVNTIRIMTFGYDGKSEILFAVMRFGNGEADVDNFHQGGMACLVDLETGKLTGQAFNKKLEFFDEHPVSKIKFDGFKIPNWDKVKKLVLTAALEDENIHLVGWDVAVTEDGATFIEGNRRPGFDIVQVLSKRGRKDIMRYCLDKINKKEGTNYRI